MMLASNYKSLKVTVVPSKLVIKRQLVCIHRLIIYKKKARGALKTNHHLSVVYFPGHPFSYGMWLNARQLNAS